MKLFDIKSMSIGFLVGMLSVSCVYAGSAYIVSPNPAKLIMNGSEVEMKSPLLNVKKEGKGQDVLYVPLNDLMKFMNITPKVSKNGKQITLTMNGMDSEQSLEIESMDHNDVDTAAIELIQKTGNWGYIEKYLPYMSKSGIDEVVEIYNSKHQNKSEHKKAADYYTK